MSRMRSFLAVAVVLAACSSTPSPSPETAFHLEISVHCGIDWSVFEYEGATYRIQPKNELETINPPPGWSDVEVVTIIEDDGQLLAIGPDGSERPLIEVRGADASPELCI